MSVGGKTTRQRLEATWIDRVHQLAEVGSTNTAALEHAKRDPGDLAELFVTDRQTAGRGRGGNRWWSGDGSLAFSVLTRRLAIDANAAPTLALTIGATLCGALSPLGERVSLKWPNDLYATAPADAGRRGASKVGGVLIESIADPARGSGRRYVLGVGINVHNSLADAPEEVRRTATSLSEAAGGGRLTPADVLLACVQPLGDALRRVAAGDPALPALWRRHSLLTGRQITIETRAGRLSGRCQTIDDQGAITVQTERGTVTCVSGTVVDFER